MASAEVPGSPPNPSPRQKGRATLRVGASQQGSVSENELSAPSAVEAAISTSKAASPDKPQKALESVNAAPLPSIDQSILIKWIRQQSRVPKHRLLILNHQSALVLVLNRHQMTKSAKTLPVVLMV